MKTGNYSNCFECKSKVISIFKNCKQEEIDLLKNKLNYKFRKNELIIEQETSFKGLICIKEGLVKVFKSSLKKDDFIFWYAEPGDILGLDAFINKQQYSLSAKALEPITACLITEEDLNNIIKQNPEFLIDLMKSLCQKIDAIENRITSMAQKKLKSQLADLLVLLANRVEANAKFITINCSVKDLANTIGTTPNYIYKILSDFSKKKIITLDHKILSVIDIIKLKQIAIEK